MAPAFTNWRVSALPIRLESFGKATIIKGKKKYDRRKAAEETNENAWNTKATVDIPNITFDSSGLCCL